MRWVLTLAATVALAGCSVDVHATGPALTTATQPGAVPTTAPPDTTSTDTPPGTPAGVQCAMSTDDPGQQTGTMQIQHDGPSLCRPVPNGACAVKGWAGNWGYQGNDGSPSDDGWRCNTEHAVGQPCMIPSSDNPGTWQNIPPPPDSGADPWVCQ